MSKRFQPEFWLDMAELMATQSSCKKAQVGCLITIDNKLIAAGVNGTTAGDNNDCENAEGKTDHWRVHHAERNALRQILPEQGAKAVIFVTLAPCWECAKEIIGYGIKKLYYREVLEKYTAVLDYLEYMGVETCSY